MPALLKKLLVGATEGGLVLQSGNRDSNEHNVRIEYETHKIVPAGPVAKDGKAEVHKLEAHGLVGLLGLGAAQFLIAITRSEEVARIRHRPIFAIRDVVLIPLSNKAEAEKVIWGAASVGNKSLKRNEGTDEGERRDEGSITSEDEGNLSEEPAAAMEPPKSALQRSATVMKNAAVFPVGGVGSYAKKWLLRGRTVEEAGLTAEQERQVENALPTEEASTEEKQKNETMWKSTNSSPAPGATAPKQKSAIEHLTPRILRGARLYFSSSGFFYSYEHDISSTLAQKPNFTATSEIPLWRRFDPLYFWNRHLMAPFIDAGQEAMVLPIMQGFVGQRAFSIARTEGTKKDAVAEAALDAEDVVKAQDESEGKRAQTKEQAASDFLLTLISRRSVKRAGLRYLRRGVDDDGNVANNVETEQILSESDSDRTFSLLQVRGSIPLFFSQSPYSFKPLPVMFGSETATQTAFKKHFDIIGRRYQHIHAASLVDKHGTEAGIGETYEKHVKHLNEHGGADGKPLAFEWFDFHSVCKGMKFENVSILMDALKPSLTSFGWLEKQNDRNVRLQTGVLRTNCMDCLDRTNVVQSSVAGWALQHQLGELGLQIDLQTDPKTQWFNTLWADNGDAISRQYAGTAALKGDFTRTRKRKWTGALSDFSLTLTRYYNNIFGDYFLQTCIDYYLGNAGSQAFEEFETDMMAQDYALDLRHVRQSAIETCIKIVLEDPNEKLAAGWTLSCPRQSNTLRTLPFEECVLLLTDGALYFCRFDWATEKLGSFERVALGDVTEVHWGPYITSALGPIHLDEARNVGFLVRYKPGGMGSVVRRNTRALGNVDNASNEEDEESKQAGEKDTAQAKGPETQILAFKALASKTAAAKDPTLDLANVSEVDIVKHICDEIQKALEAAFLKERGFQHLLLEKPVEVLEKAVISSADARKATGYVESIGYTMKRLVWS